MSEPAPIEHTEKLKAWIVETVRHTEHLGRIRGMQHIYLFLTGMALKDGAENFLSRYLTAIEEEINKVSTAEKPPEGK